MQGHGVGDGAVHVEKVRLVGPGWEGQVHGFRLQAPWNGYLLKR
jgi:hypothetical protein